MTTNQITFEVNERDFSVNPRKLRREGRIPATIYARNVESLSVDVDQKLFTHIYITQNPHLVNLVKGQETINALVKVVQMNPRTAEIQNIEFVRVSADQKVAVSLPISVVGESQAVKRGGVLLKLIEVLDVECLPKNMPNSIAVDISSIAELDQTITVGQIQYPEGVVPKMPADVGVIKIASPKEEKTATTEVAAGATPSA